MNLPLLEPNTLHCGEDAAETIVKNNLRVHLKMNNGNGTFQSCNPRQPHPHRR